MKIVFVASIIRNSLCIIYVFLLFFSKITFYWKLFLDCCDQFGYPGSIVYLSCFIFFVQISFLTKSYLLIAAIIVTTRGPLYTCLVFSLLCELHSYHRCIFLIINYNWIINKIRKRFSQLILIYSLQYEEFSLKLQNYNFENIFHT